MSATPGNYQEVDSAIRAIPLDEPEPGTVGSAKAKKYLLPGYGERAGETDEYITPADVGHAFDVIYDDMARIGKFHAVGSVNARLAMTPKPDDVVVELDTGDWWTWDAGAGTWTPIPAPINDWTFGTTEDPDTDPHPKLQPQSMIAPGTVFVGSPSGEVWQWDGSAWQDQGVSILGEKGDPGAQGPAGTTIFFGDPQNAANIAGANAARTGDLMLDPATGELHRLDGPSWQADSTKVGELIGPAGPKGAGGPTGPTGPAGAQGASGPAPSVGGQPTVTTGAPGSTAAVSVAGGGATPLSFTFDIPRGNTGDDGPTGPTGPTGDAGPAGATGIQGPAGAQGQMGASIVIEGQIGAGSAQFQPNVAQGINPAYIIEASGSPTWLTQAMAAQTPALPAPQPGHLVVWNDADGEWFDAGEIVGPQGAQGVQGVQGPIGPTGPQGIQGPGGATGPAGTSLDVKGVLDSSNPYPVTPAAGSFYVMGATQPSAPTPPAPSHWTQFQSIWSPGHGVFWDGAKWVDAGQIVGPAGPTGPQGAAGVQGTQGDVGPTGPQGLQGPRGQDGTSITIKGSVTGPTALPTGTGAVAVGDMYLLPNGHGMVAQTADPTGPADYQDVGQIQGPAGATGPAGAVGPTGPSGAAGASGAAGTAGATGPTGPTGPNAVSADAGNIATLSANDQLVFVPAPFPAAGTGAAGRVLTAPASGTPLTWAAPSPTSQVVVATVSGETPAAPGTATVPGTLNAGDVFINSADGLTWIYDGTAWQDVGAPGPSVTLTANAGDDPTNAAGSANAPTTAAPTSPVEGSLYTNTADGMSWVWSGAAWTLVASTSVVISPDDHNAIKATGPTQAGLYSRPVIPLGQTEYNSRGPALDPDVLYVITGP